MAYPEISGEWYVPGSTKKLPGRLRMDNEKKEVCLDLFAKEYLDGVAIGAPGDNVFERYPSLILGVCRTSITLYHCNWAGTKPVGKDLFEIKYVAQFAFYGVHVEKKGDFTVKSATFQFPHLSSFLDGGTGKDLLERNTMALPFNRGFENLEAIPIDDNLELIVVDQVFEKNSADFTGIERVYRQKLKFSYKNAVPFDSLIKDAAHFRNLLAFSYGRPQPYLLLEVSLNKTENESAKVPWFDDKGISVANFTLHKDKKIRHDQKPGYHMVISRWNFDERNELSAIIKQWFVNRSYAQLFDIYLDMNNWFQETGVLISNVMFNNRFTNIIQGLELYYREKIHPVHPDKEAFENRKQQALKQFKDDAALKKWVNDELKFRRDYISLEKKIHIIIQRFETELNHLFTNKSVLNNFAWYGATQRNNLSHGKQLQTYQGEAMHLFLKMGQLLLCMCILRILNITDIVGLIKYNVGFKDKIIELNRSKINRIDGGKDKETS